MPQVIKSAAVIMRLILSELNAPLISTINHNKAEIKDKKKLINVKMPNDILTVVAIGVSYLSVWFFDFRLISKAHLIGSFIVSFLSFLYIYYTMLERKSQEEERLPLDDFLKL